MYLAKIWRCHAVIFVFNLIDKESADQLEQFVENFCGGSCNVEIEEIGHDYYDL